MTPEEGLEIFWEAYTEHSNQFNGRDKLKQSDAYKAGIEAVIKAVTQEIDGDWAKRYLAWSEFNKVSCETKAP